MDENLFTVAEPKEVLNNITVPVIIFSYRYMWRFTGSENIQFKIVTDTIQGLEKFEDELFKLDNLESVGKEYLHEYDCSKIGLFEKIFGGNKV